MGIVLEAVLVTVLVAQQAWLRGLQQTWLCLTDCMAND
jgi:hypothetical protein